MSQVLKRQSCAVAAKSSESSDAPGALGLLWMSALCSFMVGLVAAMMVRKQCLWAIALLQLAGDGCAAWGWRQSSACCKSNDATVEYVAKLGKAQRAAKR